MSDDGPRIRIEWPKLRAPEHMSDFRPGLWRKLTMAHMYRQFATYDHDAFLERTGRTSDDARAPQPLRHFMPPGLAPACATTDAHPYRAIDGHPVTCPACRAYLLDSGDEPMRVARSLAGLDAW